MTDRSTSLPTMSVAVVGFGAMGAAMARRLVKDGHTVSAVDPIPDTRTGGQ
jgi:3-hydroxyisobutyrate dehydrogenase